MGGILRLGADGRAGLLSGETEALPAKLSKTAEAASSSNSAAVDFFTIYLFGACG